MKRIVLVVIVALISGVTSLETAWAQNDGQFCVRSFEDQNANGQRDAGEPLLQSGIAADLLNEGGLIVATALLSEAPTAAQGVICFQFLPAGQYTIQVSSAEYRATTPNTLTVAIREGELPAVLEFGAVSLLTDYAARPLEATESAPQVDRLIWAGIGAVAVIFAMQILGLLIYLVRYRGRRQREAVPPESTYQRPQS
jgi:hypothetical protein